jgi:hypothetical protein
LCIGVAYTDGNGNRDDKCHAYSDRDGNCDRYDHGYGEPDGNANFDGETDAHAAGSTDAETRSDTGAAPDDQADLPLATALANAVSLKLHAALFGNSPSNSRVPEKPRAPYLRARQAKDKGGMVAAATPQCVGQGVASSPGIFEGARF